MPQVQNSDSKLIYGILPALPVILGTVIVDWQYNVGMANVLISLLLVSSAVGIGLFLWHRHLREIAIVNAIWEQDQDNKFDAVVTYSTELERLLLTITPILSQHVMASREHTEQEIVSLTNRFASMVNELQQIVDSTDNALGRQNYHLDSVIDATQGFLQPIRDSLTTIQRQESTLLAELQKLSGRIEELGAFSTEFEQLAEKIKVTFEANSLNEANATTTQMSSLVRQFSVKFDETNRTIKSIEASSETAVAFDKQSLVDAENNIDQILSHLTEALTHYRNDVEALRNNADQIRVEINNVLVALQFQDRVSQILSQVENNLLNLKQTIEKIQQQGSDRDKNMLQVDQAVEHIEENYKSVNVQTTQVSDNSDDLTFF